MAYEEKNNGNCYAPCSNWNVVLRMQRKGAVREGYLCDGLDQRSTKSDTDVFGYESGVRVHDGAYLQ